MDIPPPIYATENVKNSGSGTSGNSLAALGVMKDPMADFHPNVGVIKHWDENPHRILSNVNTPKVFRQKSTSHFKPLATPIILEVKIQ